MMIRALGVWLLLLLAAIVNGGVRETVIIPRTSDAAGHAISTITLCAAILLLAWLTVGWMAPGLLADYNILRGRIWILVLVTTAIAPWLVAQGSGLLRRPA